MSASWIVSNRLVAALVRGGYWSAEKFFGLLSQARTYALWPDAHDKTPYVYWNARVKYPENIAFGHGLLVGPRCVLGAHSPIVFGDNVRLSEGAFIETGNLDINLPPPYKHVSKPTKLGNGVWIGANAVILGGVTIGDRVIVGAGAVVSKDLPDDAIYVGGPGRVLSRKTSRGSA